MSQEVGTTKSQSPIDDALSTLDKSITELRELADSFSSRLEFVKTPSSPVTSAESKKDLSNDSEMRNVILRCVVRINDIQAVIRDNLSRLQL